MLSHANAWLSAMLTAQIADGESLDDTVLGLWKNGFAPGPGDELADVEQADFEGYATQAVVTADWLGPATRSSGVPYIVTDDKVFQADDPLTTPNEIGGWFLYKGTDLVAFGTFDDPIVVDRPNQLILVRAEVGPQNNSEGGNQGTSP